MKTKFSRKKITLAAIGCVCSAMLGASGIAQDTGATRTRASQSSTTPDAESVRVTRASYYLGFDVMAKDERKVGDIVDFYFNPTPAPQLAYVVIMTGGFLNMGGDARAVPAAAVSRTGDSCKINLTRAQFLDLPVLPENRARFLSDPMHRQRITQLVERADGTASTQTSGKAGTTQSAQTAKADDPNRAGAMTGRANEGSSRLVSYSELRNTEAYGQEGQRLGYFMDAWVNLNDDRIPYVEITPTFEPFRTSFDRRYAIPTAKLAQKREYMGFNVNVSTDELNKAEWVSETEGVKMLEEGRFGNDVLRVRVPEN
jgi:hypothetical protein